LTPCSPRSGGGNGDSRTPVFGPANGSSPAPRTLGFAARTFSYALQRDDPDDRREMTRGMRPPEEAWDPPGCFCSHTAGRCSSRR